MACQGGVYDVHHAHNGEIEITGPDTATGLWSLDFRTIRLVSSSVTGLAVEYRDLYRRRDGRWWIEETESRITSFLTEDIARDRAEAAALTGHSSPTPTLLPASRRAPGS